MSTTMTSNRPRLHAGWSPDAWQSAVGRFTLGHWGFRGGVLLILLKERFMHAARLSVGKKSPAAAQAALGRYLAAGLGATGLASIESEAGVVNLNISALGSPAQNASGVNPGSASPLVIQNLIPGSGASVQINGGYGDLFGFVVEPGGKVWIANGGEYATPSKFSLGDSVGAAGSINWTTGRYPSFTTFQNYYGTSPNFGASSFIGFRVTANEAATEFNYGYFEVTWNSSTNQFQILSGAYESTVNTPIAVPEPSAAALAGIGALALGTGAIRRSRKSRKAAAEGARVEAA